MFIGTRPSVAIALVSTLIVTAWARGDANTIEFLSWGGSHGLSQSPLTTAPLPPPQPQLTQRPTIDVDPRFQAIRYPVTSDPIAKATPNAFDPFVIVALGDSFGSGEGNPSEAGLYDPDGYLIPFCSTNEPDCGGNREVLPAQWGATPDLRRANGLSYGSTPCHISSESGAAKAVAQFADAHDRIPIIYASFACSGATVEQLYSDPYAGIEPVDPPLRPQLDQLDSWRERWGVGPADVLLISAGGNNARFADIVKSCATPKIFWNCLDDREMRKSVDEGLTDLPKAFSDLNDAIQDHADEATVVLTAYPHMFSRSRADSPQPLIPSSGGPWCGGSTSFQGAMFGDVTGQISVDEARWAATAVLPALNERLADATELHSWRLTTAVFDGSFGRGICMGDRSILNTNNRALRTQGRDRLLSPPGVNLSAGIVHPNDAGYELYGDAYLSELEHIAEDRYRPAPPEKLQVVGSSPNGNIALRWHDPNKTEVLHRITARPIDGGEPVNFTIAGEDKQKFEHVLTDPGSYRYSVRACSLFIRSCSEPSNETFGSNQYPDARPFEPATAVWRPPATTSRSAFVVVQWSAHPDRPFNFSLVEYAVDGGAPTRVQVGPDADRTLVTVPKGRTVTAKVRHCTMLEGGTCGPASAMVTTTT